MLLHIRRPARPEPLPLRERTAGRPAERASGVWLSVRHKRNSGRPRGRKTSPGLGRRPSSPQS